MNTESLPAETARRTEHHRPCSPSQSTTVAGQRTSPMETEEPIKKTQHFYRGNLFPIFIITGK